MIIRFVIENEEHDNNGQLHHNIVIKETITKNDLEEISNDIEQFHKENPKWTNEQSWELFESLVKEKGYTILDSSFVFCIVPGKNNSKIDSKIYTNKLTTEDYKQTQTALICSLLYYAQIGETEMIDEVEKNLLPKINEMLKEREVDP